MGHYWTPMPAEIEFPIEASLVAEANEPPPPPPAPQRVIPAPDTASDQAPAEPLPPAPQEAEVMAVAEGDVAEPAESNGLPAETVPSFLAAADNPMPAPSDREVPARPLRPAVRVMPRQLEIKYAVLVGENGYVAGEAISLWHAREGRYSLVSTIRATGLTALFIKGHIVQVSEGSVDASGLWPEQFRLKRGERRQDSARFFWPQKRLDLGPRRGMHDLTPQAQDLLSFPFHLALTAREGEPDFTLGVTNGRRFKDYAFRNLGRVNLELGGHRIEALHLQGSREGEGTLDVWLDPERSGVPVKVRTLDQEGKAMMLLLESVRETGDR
jgi:hypothetical protein